MDGERQEGPVVLVSGGSRGLGLEVCKDLLNRGYRVATFSRQETSDVRSLSKANPNRFVFHQADMGDRSSLEDVARFTENDLGPIYGLVNNAGTVDETLLSWQKEEAVERLLTVNLMGTIWLTRSAMRGMLIRNKGRIVSISSIVAIRGFSGVAAYSATKGGINSMTRSLARELGKRGITVNLVSPGYMDTELTRDLNQRQLAQIVRRTPIKRPGRPDDATGAIAFFLSEEAGFITGQNLVVDGGLTC